MEVEGVYANARLVAETRALAGRGSIRVRRVDGIGGPGGGWITRWVDRDIDRRIVAKVSIGGGGDEQDDHEPGVGGGIVVATRIAGVLEPAQVEEVIDIEGPGNRRPVRAVDPVRRIHGLEDEAIALAERRIGRFELQTAVRHFAIEAADAVEVLQQPI